MWLQSDQPGVQVVRIFTSSTFTDMLMERNTLMEYVYPKIKGQITIACPILDSLNNLYHKINVERYQLQENFRQNNN
jgi:hypothetical protein